jgi:lipopolysaccharide export system protein LptC
MSGLVLPNRAGKSGIIVGQASFSASLGTDQDLSSGTYTVLEIDTEQYDPNGWFDITNYRWIPQVAGIYLLNGGVNFVAVEIPRLMIYKNGTIIIGGEATYDANSQAAMVTGYVESNGNADYFELVARTEGASTADAGVERTYFQGHFVA